MNNIVRIVSKSLVVPAVVAGMMTMAPMTSTATADAAGRAHCVVQLTTGGTACYPTAAQAEQACAVLAMTVFDGLDFTLQTPWYNYCLDKECETGKVLRYDRIDYYWLNANYGVNNHISSVETYNHCDVVFYDYYFPTDGPNPTSGWLSRDGNLEEWSNRASSFRLSRIFD